MNSNVLKIKSAEAFRKWLIKHHKTEKECYIALKRGKPIDDKSFWYIDAVEVALCFGWIDSTVRDIDGVKYQRFGPRKKGSFWSELNKERVRRLEKLGLMTDDGMAVLPDMDLSSFKIDKEVELALKEAGALENFKKFPSLYQRIRSYNVAFYKKDKLKFEKSLSRLIEKTLKGEMYGEWNDYGRLINY